MSNTENLTATVTVDHSPKQVFEAITDVRGWWSQNVVGATAALHDEFIFTEVGEGIRFARFELTEVTPGRRMVWHVRDCYLNFVDDHDEWTDTKVVFDLTADARGTTLRLTHEGLTAGESECYEECSRGWTFYITKSLPRLLATGAGDPMTKHGA